MDQVHTNIRQSISPATLDLLRCPDCHRRVRFVDGCLRCTASGYEHRFELRDGIPILLPERLNQRSHVAAEYYNQKARQFRDLHDFWGNPYDSATWDIENDLIASYITSDDPLLDLGVGFYPHVESTAGRRVLCVDVSRESLVIARDYYGRENSKLEYLCGDVLHLPLFDNSVGAVIAGGELINHVSAAAFLREVKRLLKPHGVMLLSIGMKWCVDSIYAVLDAHIGKRLGYGMTSAEAREFLVRPSTSTEVTWDVTPESSLNVMLYTRSDLLELFDQIGFRIRRIRSMNVLSGLIPLPWQQDPKSSTFTKQTVRGLIAVDHYLGRIPFVRWLAGNVYLVLERIA